MQKAALPVRVKLGQIILRIDDEYGHHIIRKNQSGGLFTIEGYCSKPENYQLPPNYFMPLTVEEVVLEFGRQGKEWRT